MNTNASEMSEREQLDAAIERLSKGGNTQSARVLRDHELDFPSGGSLAARPATGRHIDDALLTV